MKPVVKALVLVIAGLVAGAILMGLGFIFIGIIVAAAAIPVGLCAWIVAD